MGNPDPYNPLAKQNLGKSVAEALLIKPMEPLPPTSFEGAGIYAIYYLGDFPHYRELAESCKPSETAIPIYVGKAVPKGSRKGLLGLDGKPSRALFNRLQEHADTIDSASNIKLADFRCRYLTVDDIWIPLGEALLIETFRPLWNIAVDGFGNHDPGSGRHEGKNSSWDVLHPGRSWATRLKPGKSPELILKMIRDHLEKDSLKRGQPDQS